MCTSSRVLIAARKVSVETLKEELDVETESETDLLYQQILDGINAFVDES